MPSFYDQLLDFAIALLIGALVGIDRERKQVREGIKEIAGIRTCMLFALCGALCAYFAQQLNYPLLFLGGFLAITGLVVAGYVSHVRVSKESIGLTTEISTLIVFLLGGLTLYGSELVAVALAIGTSAVLAYREPIHFFVGKISEDDVYSALRLLVASFIILPILPDHPFDPWNAINPYKTWWLVVAISALSFIGYIAVRAMGPKTGLLLSGLFGGMVSSTAVALSFSKKSRDNAAKGLADLLACGIILSWLVMMARVVIEVLIVFPPLLGAILTPILLLLLILSAVAWWYFHQGSRASTRSKDSEIPLSNPFSLWSASKFAIFFALVLLVVRLLEESLSGSGMYILAALSGLGDVDAITLSMAEFAQRGGNQSVAAHAILIGILSNTAVKCVIAAWYGSALLAMRVGIAAAAMFAAFGTFWFSSL